SPSTLRRFERLGVRYVRNFHDGVGLSWQSTFAVRTREALAEKCRRSRIRLEWIGGRPRTSQDRHALARHPLTDGLSWFNQAHHFSFHTLPTYAREAFMEQYGPSDLPRQSYFGDGTPIPLDVIEEIEHAYELERVEFDWQRGDLLMIDNMSTAHARTPFEGERLIALTMADLHAPCPSSPGVA
ncbi:MAG: TauD/TfdA family dioxygenase, partial [Planctomycetota bacterium]